MASLGRRSVLQTLRRPQLAAPLIIFPTLLLAIQSAGAGRAIDLPGFPPVDSFLDFLLAGAMVQSAMFAGNTAGIALAVDIEMGFTDRLLTAPIPRFAIVAGRLMGTGALGAITAIWFLVVGVLFGVRIDEGIPGALLMFVLVTLSALAFGSLGAALALRTGSASVVQGMFPLVFVILFMSTAFFPQDLLVEPASTIAEYNPLSFIAEAVRDPVISSFSISDLLKGIGGIALVGAAGVTLSARALKRRIRVG
ncbi:MAG: ABC transporter permease [Solirubrobacterales bacterium]|nr:ABC transporter permease [Solirubrobacterales bacterium]